MILSVFFALFLPCAGMSRVFIDHREGAVMGLDCAVCLDEIKSEQRARLIPDYNHGFQI
ncbi:hypothetical protein ACOSQ4_011321 [Xanthoceras sorbifolium]